MVEKYFCSHQIAWKGYLSSLLNTIYTKEKKSPTSFFGHSWDDSEILNSDYYISHKDYSYQIDMPKEYLEGFVKLGTKEFISYSG